MKIGEARKEYSSKLQTLQEQKRTLLKAIKEQKQQDELDDTVVADKSGVILELTDYSKELDKKIKETQDYLNQLSLYSVAIHNREAARQQGEAMAEEAVNTAKCIEVARRISRGHKVPPQDEKKLMEYSSEMYSMAKCMGAIAKREEEKKYKSLWEEEKKNSEEQTDIDSKIDDMTAPIKEPEGI